MISDRIRRALKVALALLALCFVPGAYGQERQHIIRDGVSSQIPSQPAHSSVFNPTEAAASKDAQTELSVIVYASRVLVGLTPGQTLRVSAAYPVDPVVAQQQALGTVVARVSLSGADGALLTRSPEATIAPNGFHSFDFDRAEIPGSGEPRTGRLQLRVRLELSVPAPRSFTHDPKSTGLLPVSFELLDSSTGRSAAVWVTVGFFEVETSPKP